MEIQVRVWMNSRIFPIVKKMNCKVINHNIGQTQIMMVMDILFWKFLCLKNQSEQNRASQIGQNQMKKSEIEKDQKALPKVFEANTH